MNTLSVTYDHMPQIELLRDKIIGKLWWTHTVECSCSGVPSHCVNFNWNELQEKCCFTLQTLEWEQFSLSNYITFDQFAMLNKVIGHCLSVWGVECWPRMQIAIVMKFNLILMEFENYHFLSVSLASCAYIYRCSIFTPSEKLFPNEHNRNSICCAKKRINFSLSTRKFIFCCCCFDVICWCDSQITLNMRNGPIDGTLVPWWRSTVGHRDRSNLFIYALLPQIRAT